MFNQLQIWTFYNSYSELTFYLTEITCSQALALHHSRWGLPSWLFLFFSWARWGFPSSHGILRLQPRWGLPSFLFSFFEFPSFNAIPKLQSRWSLPLDCLYYFLLFTWLLNSKQDGGIYTGCFYYSGGTFFALKKCQNFPFFSFSAFFFDFLKPGLYKVQWFNFAIFSWNRVFIRYNGPLDKK